MADQRSPRRRFQFRLRTLFLLIAIVAAQCAVCFPMLREWTEWHDAGGTGSIAPFAVDIIDVVPQGRLVRRQLRALRRFVHPHSSAAPSTTQP